jgi:bla regulator protein blaR1
MSTIQGWSSALAGRALNGLPEGFAIALFAWILLRVVGRRSASTRFAVWLSALLAIAVLPLLGGLAATSVPAATVAAMPAITVPSLWASVLFIMWAVVAGGALFRVGLGVWQLRKLRAGTKPVDPASLDPLLQTTLAEFQVSRTVTLAVSEHLRVPTAIGFFKPMIVLPAWALAELSTEELNSILIHELAHVQRRDDWTNLAEKALRALLFFNPAVWWIANQISLEREMACDDVVLSRTANPRAYAACLVAVAERSFMRRGLALAQAAVGRVRQTSRRVSQILDANRPGATRVWKPALCLLTLFSAVCFITRSQTPELVAFQDAPVRVASASAPVAGSVSNQIATVIPATLKTVTPLKTKVTAARKTARPTLPAARSLEAKRTQPTVPTVLQATLPDDRQFGVQTVFVVMQTGDGSSLPVSWTICIWRVTVVNSTPAPIEIAIPVKSI